MSREDALEASGVSLVIVIKRFASISNRTPHAIIALISRLAAASTFWTAGQAKIEGLTVDLFRLRFDPGRPQISETSLELFTYLYRIDVARPDIVFAVSAATEHVLAALLFLGFLTRISALVLLAVTVAVEFFVYPEAYATYGLWVSALLYLFARGAGIVSIDYWLAGLLKARDPAVSGRIPNSRL
ncbi:MAG: DoxX family membrane protein [Rhodospirillales bacterium]|nr:DoxX family membrane protein [Rhodospirillales bacterium]